MPDGPVKAREVSNVRDYDIVLYEFKIQSRYQFHFRKGLNLLIPTSYASNSVSIFFLTRMALLLKKQRKVDILLNEAIKLKQTK